MPSSLRLYSLLFAAASAVDETSLMQDVKKPAKVQRKTDKKAAVTNLLESAKGFLKNGATPEVTQFTSTTLDMINTEVMDLIADAGRVDQQYINNVHAVFGDILGDLVAGNEEIRQLRTEERAFSGQHKSCRDTEHERCEAKRTCENHMWNLWKEWEACEIGLREKHDEIDGHFCPPGTNGTLHSFRVASVPLMDEYIEWKLDCDRKETAYDNVRCDNNGHDFVHVTSLQTEEPVSIHNLLDTRSGLCNDVQTELEHKSCELAVRTTSVVHSWDTTYAEQVTHFEQSVADALVQQLDRQKEYCTLQTVTCLMERVYDLNGAPCDSESGEVDNEIAHCEGSQLDCDPCAKVRSDGEVCVWRWAGGEHDGEDCGHDIANRDGAGQGASDRGDEALSFGGSNNQHEHDAQCVSVGSNTGLACDAPTDWVVLAGALCIQAPPVAPPPDHCDNCNLAWTENNCIPVTCEWPCNAGFTNQEYASLPAVPQAIFTELNPGCNQYPPCQDCDAMMQVTILPVVVPVAPEEPLWSQHMEDSAKCNNNVDVQYVNSQAECQQIAVAAGHPYYSFRHNEESSGHKCMSSATCVDIVTDTSNEWNMYMETIMTTGNDGNGIVSSGGPDGASSIQFIDLGAGAFESAGEIKNVRYHVSRANQAGQKFQIYRPVGGTTYKLISETVALASTQAGSIVTHELATPLQFQAGDFIGWVHTGQGTFPFRGGGSVRWKYGIEGVGSDIDFNGAGSRIYGYEASFTTR